MPRRRRRTTETTEAQASTPQDMEQGAALPISEQTKAVSRGPGTVNFLTNWQVPFAKWADGDDRIPQYYTMRREDSACAASLNAITLLVLKHLGQYQHEDPKVEAFVTDALNSMQGGLRKTVRSLLSSLWAGYAVAERQVQARGTEWVYKRIRPLHPLTLFPDGIRPNAAGDVTEFVQNKGRMGVTPTTLEWWRCVYWPFGQEFSEQAMGRSLLEPAYRSWFTKDAALNWWPMWAERNVMPIAYGTVGEEKAYSEEQGKAVEATQVVMEWFQNLSPGSALVTKRGADGEGGVKLDFLETNVNAGDAYEKLIYAMDGIIFRSVLMPRLAIEEAQYGTRAQAETALSFFMANIEGVMAELGEVLVHQVCQPLVRWNFGELDTWGEWRFDEMESKDLETLSRVATNLASSGFVRVTAADQNKTREVFAELLAPQDEAEASAVAGIAESVARYGGAERAV